MKAYQILPLALIYQAGGKIEGRTRIQKLTFLSSQRLEEEGIDLYDFIPYDYGPFDKQVYDALDFLRAEGFVEQKEIRTYGGDTRYDYMLTEKGYESVQENVPEEETESIGDISPLQRDVRTIFDIAGDVVDEYNDMPISNLLDRVYDEYPEYTSESVLY